MSLADWMRECLWSASPEKVFSECSFLILWSLSPVPKLSEIETSGALPKPSHSCFFLFFLLFLFCKDGEEKAMATHSSALAWKIPWIEEPGRLQSMGSLRVGHDWATSLSLFTFMHWRRKWQPTPVFLPGESQGRGSLVGCRLWGRTESDMTEAT